MICYSHRFCAMLMYQQFTKFFFIYHNIYRSCLQSIWSDCESHRQWQDISLRSNRTTSSFITRIFAYRETLVSRKRVQKITTTMQQIQIPIRKHNSNVNLVCTCTQWRWQHSLRKFTIGLTSVRDTSKWTSSICQQFFWISYEQFVANRKNAHQRHCHLLSQLASTNIDASIRASFCLIYAMRIRTQLSSYIFSTRIKTKSNTKIDDKAWWAASWSTQL